MLNKEYLVSEYNSHKNMMIESYNNGKIEDCLDLAEYCAYIAWCYPIIYNYVDEEIEKILENAVNNVLGDYSPNLSNKKNDKKVVIYAGQVIDLGALTEQYLNFFIEKGFDVLLIIPNIKYTLQGKDSMKRLRTRSNVKIFIPEAKSKILKIKHIYDEIEKFNPSRAFLHFLPNDVIGYCVFSKIISIPKFYVVHNDHTFWLGKGCSDYFIEFRKFGYLLSIQRRNIPFKKILLLPYYPLNHSVPFEGLPFDKKDNVIGISGAYTMYKYLMDPELKYFHAIKELLKQNPNFIFCLCGSGADDKILGIFMDEEIKNRFYYLGRRNDFYNLVGQCDILFESYPLKGGLTVLFAIEQKKAVVGIGNNKNASGCIQDWFDLEDYKEPLNIKDFIIQADRLIKDPKFREQNASIFSNNKFNRTCFDKGLESIIMQETIIKPLYNGESLKLDDEYFLNEYICLPDAEVLLLRNRLYTLRKVLGMRERIRILYRICKITPKHKLFFEIKSLLPSLLNVN